MTGWGANKVDDYNAMWKHVIEDEPHFVHRCSPCRKRSVMQQRMPLERRVDLEQRLTGAE